LLVDTEFYYKDAQGQIVPGLYKFDVLITTYEMVTYLSPRSFVGTFLNTASDGGLLITHVLDGVDYN